MTGYLGEVLYRQGWHTRRFDDRPAAQVWTAKRIQAADGSVNPVQRFRIREAPDGDALADPVTPARTFDEAYPLDKAWPDP